MPTVRQSEPRTLRTLNRVLAAWLGGDPATAGDLDAALLFMEEDAAQSPETPWAEERLVEAARHLVRLHAPSAHRRINAPELALVDFRGEPFDPLFARIRILDAIAAIRPEAEPLLWVTGLREVFAPTGRRRAAKAAEFLAAQAMIEDLVMRHAGRNRPVKLIFL